MGPTIATRDVTLAALFIPDSYVPIVIGLLTPVVVMCRNGDAADQGCIRGFIGSVLFTVGFVPELATDWLLRLAIEASDERS